MEIRTTRSKVTFPHAFALSGSDELLPAGEYRLVIEEERMQGQTFDAYLRTGMFLDVAGPSRHVGRAEMRPVSDAELEKALGHDPNSPAGFILITDAGAGLQKQRP